MKKDYYGWVIPHHNFLLPRASNKKQNKKKKKKNLKTSLNTQNDEKEPNSFKLFKYQLYTLLFYNYSLYSTNYQYISQKFLYWKCENSSFYFPNRTKFLNLCSIILLLSQISCYIWIILYWLMILMVLWFCLNMLHRF